MFIRKQLIAKVKEEIFKKALQNKLDAFLNIEARNITPDMVEKNLNVLSNLEHIEGYILSSGENNLYDLIRDLLNVVRGSKNYKFLSEFGQDLKYIQTIADTKVQRAFENSSKTTRSVAFHLMKLSKNSVLVGGCVRDAILSRDPKDWDFATDAHYDVVEEELKNAGFKIKEAG